MPFRQRLLFIFVLLFLACAFAARASQVNDVWNYLVYLSGTIFCFLLFCFLTDRWDEPPPPPAAPACVCQQKTISVTDEVEPLQNYHPASFAIQYAVIKHETQKPKNNILNFPYSPGFPLVRWSEEEKQKILTSVIGTAARVI